MEAGKLDRKIRIEQSIASRSATGEKSRTWVPLAIDVPAAVELPSTRQAMNSQQLQSEVDIVLTIRYRNDVTPTENLQIKFDGRSYRIKGVRELGRREGLRLDCAARAE